LALTHDDARRLDEALDADLKALTIRERLVRLTPDEATVWLDLAQTLNNVAVILAKQGRRPEALAMYRQAAEYSASAFARAPQVVESGRTSAVLHINVASLEHQAGRPDAAVAAWHQALEVRRRLARDNPSVRYLQVDLFNDTCNFAGVLKALGREGEVLRVMRQAREVIEEIPDDTADYFLALGSIRAACAALVGGGKADLTPSEQAERRKDLDAAMDALRRMVAAGPRDAEVTRLKENRDLDSLRGRDEFRDLIARAEAAAKAAADADPKPAVSSKPKPSPKDDDSTNRRGRAVRATALHATGLIQLRRDKAEAARESLRQAQALRQQLSAEEPTDLEARAGLMTTRLALGEADWKAGRLADALASWLSALDDLNAGASVPLPAEPAAAIADALLAVAEHCARGGLWAEAADFLDRAAALTPPAITDKQALRAVFRVILHRQAGDLDAARRAWREMLDHFGPSSDPKVMNPVLTTCPDGSEGPRTEDLARRLTAHVGDSGNATRFIQGGLGAAELRCGRFDRAADWFAQCAAQATGITADGVTWARFGLALALYRQGREAEARREYAAAARISDAHLPTVRVDRAEDWLGWLDCDLLRREAAAALGLPAGPHPCLLLAEAATRSALGQVEPAEAAFRAAVESRPDDPAVWLERSRTFVKLGQADRAAADLAEAQKRPASDPSPWIRYGRFLSERGDHAKADECFAKAATLAPHELYHFLEAGSWNVGPYPKNTTASYPPERNPDPSKPVYAADTNEQYSWVLPYRNVTTSTSVYSLYYVYAPQERTTNVLCQDTSAARVWLNGRLVHEAAGLPPGMTEWVPVTLRPGRNTLLVQVALKSGVNWGVRLGDHPIDRADDLYWHGLWPEAADELARGLEQGPPFPEPWRTSTVRRHYLTLLLGAGRTDEFRQELARMVRDLGNTPDPAAAKDVAAACGLVPDSGADFARLAKVISQPLTPADRPDWALFAAALAHYRAGQFDKAKAFLDECVARHDGWAPCLPLLALTCHRLGQAQPAAEWLTKAEDWCARAVRDHTGHPTLTLPLTRYQYLIPFQVLLREARAAVGGRDPAEGPDLAAIGAHHRQVRAALDPTTALFDQAVLTNPDDPNDRLVRGHRLAELGHWPEAEADFAKAVELKPKDAQLWQRRGRLYAELRRWDQAAADFAKALELTPTPRVSPGGNYPWLSGRAGIDDELARWDEVFDRVAKLRPTDAGLWARRTYYLSECGRWPAAAAAATRAVELAPDDYFGGYIRATLLVQTGDRAAYQAACRAMLERFQGTTDRRTAANVAKACLLAPGAVADLGPVVRLSEFAVAGGEKEYLYYWYVYTRALADVRTGDYARAAERLVTIPPLPNNPHRNANVAALLALANHHLGRADDARQALAEAKAVLQRGCPESARGQPFVGGWDWLHVRFFVHEAEALLGPNGDKAAE
jgi:tetratricopeptide (TPR) repeat protein